jgi:hypothetical protein
VLSHLPSSRSHRICHNLFLSPQSCVVFPAQKFPMQSLMGADTLVRPIALSQKHCVAYSTPARESGSGSQHEVSCSAMRSEDRDGSSRGRPLIERLKPGSAAPAYSHPSHNWKEREIKREKTHILFPGKLPHTPAPSSPSHPQTCTRPAPSQPPHQHSILARCACPQTAQYQGTDKKCSYRPTGVASHRRSRRCLPCLATSRRIQVAAGNCRRGRGRRSIGWSVRGLRGDLWVLGRDCENGKGGEQFAARQMD